MTFSFYISSTELLNKQIPSTDEAIKIFIENEEDRLIVNFEMFEGVYVYKNKIKIYIGTIDYSFNLNGSILYIKDEFLGYQPILPKDFSISIKMPDNVLNENIYLEYQGCFDKIYCYKKEVKKIIL